MLVRWSADRASHLDDHVRRQPHRLRQAHGIVSTAARVEQADAHHRGDDGHHRRRVYRRRRIHDDGCGNDLISASAVVQGDGDATHTQLAGAAVHTSVRVADDRSSSAVGSLEALGSRLGVRLCHGKGAAQLKGRWGGA